MDSNNLKSKVGHLAKTENLSLNWDDHSLGNVHGCYIHKLSPNLNNHNSSCPLNILN